MKKWIATYIFFVGIFLFSLNGNATCGPQKTSVKKSITLVSKKIAHFFSAGADHDQPDNDQICSSVYNIHAAGHSATSSFLPGEYIPACLYTDSINISVASPTMRLNSYLLHLYPSHYFW